MNKILKQFIEEVINEAIKSPTKKLSCFDFDDTMLKMDCKVSITKADGTKLMLAPAEYAVYEEEPGDSFDFSDFRGEKLINPREITWMTKIFRQVVSKRGPEGAVILTARPKEGVPQIKTFFKTYNLPAVKIVALGTADPQAKADWILGVAKKYDEIEFFDDSYKNVEAVRVIADKVPGTRIISRLVKNRKF